MLDDLLASALQGLATGEEICAGLFAVLQGSPSSCLVNECVFVLLQLEEQAAEVARILWKNWYVKFVTAHHHKISSTNKTLLTVALLASFKTSMQKGPGGETVFFLQRLSCTVCYFGTLTDNLPDEVLVDVLVCISTNFAVNLEMLAAARAAEAESDLANSLSSLREQNIKFFVKAMRAPGEPSGSGVVAPTQTQTQPLPLPLPQQQQQQQEQMTTQSSTQNTQTSQSALAPSSGGRGGGSGGGFTRLHARLLFRDLGLAVASAEPIIESRGLSFAPQAVVGFIRILLEDIAFESTNLGSLQRRRDGGSLFSAGTSGAEAVVEERMAAEATAASTSTALQSAQLALQAITVLSIKYCGLIADSEHWSLLHGLTSALGLLVDAACSQSVTDAVTGFLLAAASDRLSLSGSHTAASSGSVASSSVQARLATFVLCGFVFSSSPAAQTFQSIALLLALEAAAKIGAHSPLWAALIEVLRSVLLVLPPQQGAALADHALHLALPSWRLTTALPLDHYRPASLSASLWPGAVEVLLSRLPLEQLNNFKKAAGGGGATAADAGAENGGGNGQADPLPLPHPQPQPQPQPQAGENAQGKNSPFGPIIESLVRRAVGAVTADKGDWSLAAIGASARQPDGCISLITCKSAVLSICAAVPGSLPATFFKPLGLLLRDVGGPVITLLEAALGLDEFTSSSSASSSTSVSSAAAAVEGLVRRFSEQAPESASGASPPPLSPSAIIRMDIGRMLGLLKLIQVVLAIHKHTAASPLDTLTLLRWASCTAMAASKAARLLEQSLKYGAIPAPAAYSDTLTALLLEAAKATCLSLDQALPCVRPTNALEMRRGREVIELMCAAGMRCPEGCGRWRLFVLLHFCFTQSVKSKLVLDLIPPNWSAPIKSLRKQELFGLELPGRPPERVNCTMRARVGLFSQMWMSSQFVERAARGAHCVVSPSSSSSCSSASSASASALARTLGSRAAALALLSRGGEAGCGSGQGQGLGRGLQEGEDGGAGMDIDEDEEGDGGSSHFPASLGGGLVHGLCVALPPALLSRLSRETRALRHEAAGGGGGGWQGQSKKQRLDVDVI